jgi:membrane-associated phospholipid phosphatase
LRRLGAVAEQDKLDQAMVNQEAQPVPRAVERDLRLDLFRGVWLWIDRASSRRVLSAEHRGDMRLHARAGRDDLHFGPGPGHWSLRDAGLVRLRFSQHLIFPTSNRRVIMTPCTMRGTLHGLNLSRLVGILTFPSFHAASAALYIWAFSPLRWLRLLLVPCNILMIAASPVGGGHYFVDVFAGIAVSAAAIVVTLRISYMVAPKILAQALPRGEAC